jgi:DNA-binding transcriptional ArsR family regulator
VAPQRSSRLPVPETVRLFRLLGHPTRLRILLFLLQRREASVGETVAAMGPSQFAASKHLATLGGSGLVAGRAEGRRRLYRVTSPLVAELLDGVGEG